MNFFPPKSSSVDFRFAATSSLSLSILLSVSVFGRCEQTGYDVKVDF